MDRTKTDAVAPAVPSWHSLIRPEDEQFLKDVATHRALAGKQLVPILVLPCLAGSRADFPRKHRARRLELRRLGGETSRGAGAAWAPFKQVGSPWSNQEPAHSSSLFGL
jgi:hypothetical protein